MALNILVEYVNPQCSGGPFGEMYMSVPEMSTIEPPSTVRNLGYTVFERTGSRISNWCSNAGTADVLFKEMVTNPGDSTRGISHPSLVVNDVGSIDRP